MSPIEPILAFAICIVGAGFYFWTRHYLKNKVAEANKTEEYNRNKAAVGAIIYPVVGIVLIGVMLFKWDRIPQENIGFAIGFIVFAVGLIVSGIYRWYKQHRST